MLSTITSGAVYGVHSHLIQVEVDVSQGLPCFQIVGLPGSEVREARERVKVALKNVGIRLPPMCININLSPKSRLFNKAFNQFKQSLIPETDSLVSFARPHLEFFS